MGWRELCGAAHVSYAAEEVLDRPHLERSVLEEVPSDQREGRLELAHVLLQLLRADAETLLEAGFALAGEGAHPSHVVARCDGRVGVSPSGDRREQRAVRTFVSQRSGTLHIFVRCAIVGRLSELHAAGDGDANQHDESSQAHGGGGGAGAAGGDRSSSTRTG